MESMNIRITPHKKGDGGIICMPLVKNLPLDTREKHPDWQIVICRRCGQLCYESGIARERMELESELKACCTECALKAGLRNEN